MSGYVVTRFGVCALVGDGRQIEYTLHSTRPRNYDSETPSGLAQNFLEAGMVPLFDGFHDIKCPSCSLCSSLRYVLPGFRERDSHAGLLDTTPLNVDFHKGFPALENDARMRDVRTVVQRYSRLRFPKIMQSTDDVLGTIGYMSGMQLYTAEARLGEQLIGFVCFTTVNKHAYASHVIFDPLHDKKAPGNVTLLRTMQHLRDKMKFDYFNMGSWAPGTRYAWKDQFGRDDQPGVMEIHSGGKWIPHRRAKPPKRPKPILS